MSEYKMKVFISWSGELSHKVAIAFRDWLPSVVQTIEPYVSSEDIDKGARWGTDIAGELEKSFYGILCLTRENVDAPWMNFEAGALSKAIDSSKVSPFLFRLKRSDITTGPLLQFQSTLDTKDEILKLLQSINRCQKDNLLDENRLQHAFEIWWPELEKKLEVIADSEHKVPTTIKSRERSDKGEEILEEMLKLLLQQNRIINSPTDLIPPAYLFSVMSDVTGGHDAMRPVLRDLLGMLERIDEVVSSGSVAGPGLEKLKATLSDVRSALLYARRRINPRRVGPSELSAGEA